MSDLRGFEFFQKRLYGRKRNPENPFIRFLILAQFPSLPI
ncbi:Uncharacterized protein dnm_076880 [Desulfonema magnum]|uniref:Uncharacterized protein n=1 Tax=Desulfonema magnum TaxID=45655 RepID=A0A975GS25_9BACT|nr:Uncharacterized protein dnm_076880 [Desulfonema magnum]